MAKSFSSRIPIRRAWRAIVPPSFRRYGQGVAGALARRRVNAVLAADDPAPATGPIIIAGLVSGTKGVSRAARLTVEAIRQAGYSPVVYDLAPLFASHDGSAARLAVNSPGGVLLMHANAPEAVAALSRLDPRDWLGRYRIAYWAYELPRVPPGWVRSAEAFHEIWVPSRFVADALVTSGVRKPVRVMPHPVALGAPARKSFARNDEFLVLAMGDLKSSATRKNLIGAIEIYKRVFPSEALSRRLVLKLQSDDADPRFRTAALTAAAGRGDIHFNTESVSDDDIEQLIASASVLLSPHRSEGFGLVLAEAFLAGVPALATGWSGNVDFMSALPELMISYSLVQVRDRSRVYQAPGLRWAEPDIEDAAMKLSELSGSTDLRRELAAQGREAVGALSAAWARDALTAMPFGQFAQS